MRLEVKCSFYDRSACRPRFVGEHFEVDEERGSELMEKLVGFVERTDAPEAEQPVETKPKRPRKKVAQ